MSEKRPTLCIVAGPNGSGKTSTTRLLLQNEWTADSVYINYINPDNIAQEVFGDWNSPEAVLKAAEEANRQRYECLEQRKDFVFETVFSSQEKLDFVCKAKAAGFFVQFFYVCTESPEINISLRNGTPLIVGRDGLKDLEVLVLEANPDPNTDFPKLKMTLERWFKGMGVKKVRVVKTDTPTNTAQFIDNFFEM